MAGAPYATAIMSETGQRWSNMPQERLQATVLYSLVVTCLDLGLAMQAGSLGVILPGQSYSAPLSEAILLAAARHNTVLCPALLANMPGCVYILGKVLMLVHCTNKNTQPLRNLTF